jgi:hypothetical protein
MMRERKSNNVSKMGKKYEQGKFDFFDQIFREFGSKIHIHIQKFIPPSKILYLNPDKSGIRTVFCNFV